jgi:hypothetical protein
MTVYEGFSRGRNDLSFPSYGISSPKETFEKLLMYADRLELSRDVQRLRRQARRRLSE